MIITKHDVLWNYGATFLKIASSIIILPLILKMMPPETVGIWTVFTTITTFANLLDFGFNPSFARNVTYVFSGVKELNVNGFEKIDSCGTVEVNYGLLKGVISAMKWIYLRMALVLLVILSTVGTYYMYTILQHYKGDTREVYIAWALLCIINTYNLFTLYYDSLLQGKGLVKRSKQIIIIGYVVYLAIAMLFILLGFGLIAIVTAQISSTIIIRILSHRAFFTAEMKENLAHSVPRDKKQILDIIYPNALKVGLTSLGGFVIQKSSMIIGALYLSLENIASYGISMQFIAVISSLASIYLATFIPKIVHLRVMEDIRAIRRIYLQGELVLILSYVIGGGMFLLIGPFLLHLIGSRTQLMPLGLLALALLLSFVETNLSNAGNILLTKNDVPFFVSSLVSGVFIIVGLFISLRYMQAGLIAILVVPLAVNLFYQGWKWPVEVMKDLKVDMLGLFKK
ncbi:O-unit flippase-like protein [Flavobacterium humi]|uniref:Polysaccharide biosynthesis protein n=1 Tax=Flavobacterium humi TaxID=2562683 RepID=A0A4Z0L7K8_9FLAO|nr:O-unit flippase-like protein [Flavobacterium humi]TGD57136.1 hypothetical protein E4635_13285 [Flavobacterium humi]